jgi:subtilisin-like proprotein convertase family protein
MTNKRPARIALLACASVASLGLPAGASPAAAKTKTVTSTFSQCQNVAVALADHSSQQVAFSVPATPKKAKPRGGTVTGVSLAGVRITHTFDEDIVIYLVSPSGRAIPLTVGAGGSGNDYGSGAANCTGTLTTFSDTATTLTSAGTAPFAGSFKPVAPLSSLVGGTASGVWTMLFADSADPDVGVIHAASLSFTYQYKVPVKKKKK